MKSIPHVLLFLLAGALTLQNTGAACFPAQLHCDFFTEPLGIDSANPSLDWVLQTSDSSARGLTQSAYQILVAASPELLAKDTGDLWDSGKIASDQTYQISYAGKTLKSNQTAWWKVRVWDGSDQVTAWSSPATWTMGVLTPGDWNAKWITAPASLQGGSNSTFLLRHEFSAKSKLKRATVNICGLGQYEISINGRKLTTNVLTPGWTEYTKTCLYDMIDCQLDDGLIPTHVPEYPIMSPKWRDSIEWGTTGILMPWQQFEFTGDIAGLRNSYPMMRRYLDYLTSKATDGIAAPGLGDWNGLRANTNTPNKLIATALYFENARAVTQSTRLLGKPDEAAAYEKLAATIRIAFNATFFHADTGQYGTGSQCANAMALDLGLVEPANRPAVLQHIVDDLAQQHYAMTIGEVGLPYLLRALAAGGRSDVIFDMANQTEYPGHGYQLKMGATALPETWNAGRDNTQIQFILGHIIEWFYHDLAGIQPDPASPGFKHFFIHPDIVGNLTVNNDSVTEGGKLIAESGGVTFLNFQDSHASYQVGSGDYTFKAEMPSKYIL